MVYFLLEPDNTTPIDIRQPRHATWQRETIGRFADGTPRRAHYVTVLWQFGPLTATEYQVFVSNRPADGMMQFETWKQAEGGTAAEFVQCSGILDPIDSGQVGPDGRVYGVQVTFTRVEEV